MERIYFRSARADMGMVSRRSIGRSDHRHSNCANAGDLFRRVTLRSSQPKQLSIWASASIAVFICLILLGIRLMGQGEP